MPLPDWCYIDDEIVELVLAADVKIDGEWYYEIPEPVDDIADFMADIMNL